MSKVKTAVSIQDSIFREVDVLAHKIHISRSNLFERAIEDFLKKQKNQQIFQQLNTAYGDQPDRKEKKWQREVKVSHRRILERNNGY